MRLYSLPTTDNATFQKSVAIEANDLDTVDDAFYASTVFETFKGFQTNIPRFERYLLGSLRKRLVETPLMPERGNSRKAFYANKNKGVAWGLRLVDYRTNNPLLTVVVDKDGANYSYKSVIYNGATKEFEDSQSATQSLSDKNALLAFVQEKLTLDVAKFEVGTTAE
jgi:hypothetical protein